MKIKQVEILLLGLPMIRPFETSFGRMDHKETTLVKITTEEGILGYGEAAAFFAPLYNEETNDTCCYMLEKFLGPAVVHKSFENAEDFRKAYSNYVGHRIAKCGIEAAFWHCLAQEKNKSLQQMFGGVQTSIPVGESIGISPTIEETLAEIDKRLSEGYVRIKLKVKPGWDIKLLDAVRARWPKIDLMADANSAYRLKDLAILKQFDNFNLTMIEQPLAEDDIIDHAVLQKAIKTPVCMDESIKSVEDARKAIEIGACKIINIKPVRVGGFVESMQIHDLAKEKGVGVWCGGMLETGIGRAFNIAVASKENYIYPADMSPYQLYYKEDLVEPSFVVKPDGHIDVSTAPGLGYNIQEDRIKKYTLKKMVVW